MNGEAVARNVERLTPIDDVSEAIVSGIPVNKCRFASPHLVHAQLWRRRDAYRAQRGEFPAECAEAEYERRLAAAYPIHAEMFDRLHGEWSTLEHFQRNPRAASSG